MPTWLVRLTYAVGFVDLANVSAATPTVYVMPAWIALVSVVLLVGRPPDAFDLDAAPEGDCEVARALDRAQQLGPEAQRHRRRSGPRRPEGAGVRRQCGVGRSVPGRDDERPSVSLLRARVLLWLVESSRVRPCRRRVDWFTGLEGERYAGRRVDRGVVMTMMLVVPTAGAPTRALEERPPGTKLLAGEIASGVVEGQVSAIRGRGTAGRPMRELSKRCDRSALVAAPRAWDEGGRGIQLPGW